MKLHLVMPMGGAGIRFAESVGFSVPKPLIPLHDKPFFYWAAKCVLDHYDVSRIMFIVLLEHLDRYQISDRIHECFPEANVVVIPKQLNGPVLTSYLGTSTLQERNDEMIMFNDCDHWFRSTELEAFLKQNEPCTGLVTFRSKEPQFSYVRYDETGKIIGTVEKKVVSDHAICGAYLFRNLAAFRAAAEHYITDGVHVDKEFFMSGLYNHLPKDEEIRTWNLDTHISFGTPAEYEHAKSETYDMYFR